VRHQLANVTPAGHEYRRRGNRVDGADSSSGVTGSAGGAHGFTEGDFCRGAQFEIGSGS
jgi:hypothetical protein